MQVSEAAIKRYFYKKMFEKYAANMENIYGEVWFQ